MMYVVIITWRYLGKILVNLRDKDDYMDGGHDADVDNDEEEIYLEVALELLLLGLRKTSPWVGVPARS